MCEPPKPRGVAALAVSKLLRSLIQILMFNQCVSMDMLHIVRSVKFSTLQSFTSFNGNNEPQSLILIDLSYCCNVQVQERKIHVTFEASLSPNVSVPDYLSSFSL